MPRVHSQKANKDYPDQGIKKGDTYYSWSFRYGGTYKSKTYPKPSQLTQGKLSSAYAAQEDMESAVSAASTLEDITIAADDCANAIREVADEYQDSLDAMPTQEGPVAEGIQEKIDALNEYADELESAASTASSNFPDDFDELDEEEKEAALEEAREEVLGVSLDV